MRIRTIKPEFFHHEGLFDAERESQLPLRIAFAGLWCVADREGRFKWEPRRIGVQILPYDQVDFSRVLHALATRGYLVKYRVGNECFGLIPSFKRHQVINNRELASQLPAHDSEGAVIEPVEPRDDDASTTRDQRVEHAGLGEGKGKEGKGKETPIPPDRQPPASLARFDEFWSLYPRKVAKPKAQAKWVKLTEAERAAILADIPRKAASEQWTKDGGAFIPHPTTYLAQRRWEDEVMLIAHRNGVVQHGMTDEEILAAAL